MSVDFLETLRRSELLSSEDIATIVRSEHLTAESDPKDIAKAFINRHQLTLFQANQLLHGQARGFFIDHYKLREILGTGGMGWVYIAEPRNVPEGTHERVAIKVLSDRLKHDVGLRARFELEARAGLQLHHDNIVKTLQYGLSNDLYGEVPFMVMEFVEGINLQDLMRQRRGPLPWRQAADCIRQAADGLQHAHERGMVHRDIKPTNLLITRDGNVKILDFGLALLLNDDQSEFSLAMIFGHQCLGTDDYIAPEQTFNSHSVDGRADIYSLGCTLYHILTGVAPYPLAKTPQKIEAHRFTKFPSVRDLVPEIPEQLANILAKMVTKLPEERYSTAAEVSAALAPFCQRESIEFDFNELLKVRAGEARKRLQLARPSSRSHQSSTTLKPLSGVALPPAPQAVVETRIPADTTPRNSSIALSTPVVPEEPALKHPGFHTDTIAADYPHLRLVEQVKLMLVPVPDAPPVLLNRERMVIGRSQEALIRLDSTRVSSKHALLSLEGQWWRISDLKSRNGIRVNGVATTDQLLWPGDRISIADQFHFVLKEIPQAKKGWPIWSIALAVVVAALVLGATIYLMQPAAHL
ncbi:MAG: protein kinase [Planctomycetota bacterium]